MSEFDRDEQRALEAWTVPEAPDVSSEVMAKLEGPKRPVRLGAAVAAVLIAAVVAASLMRRESAGEAFSARSYSGILADRTTQGELSGSYRSPCAEQTWGASRERKPHDRTNPSSPCGDRARRSSSGCGGRKGRDRSDSVSFSGSPGSDFSSVPGWVAAPSG